MKDYYEILGVSPQSDEVVIRAAFKALMLKFHPDTNKGANATARAAEINEAFGVIGTAEKRAAYDRQRAAYASSQKPEARAKPRQADARTAQQKPAPRKAPQRPLTPQQPQPARMSTSWGILGVVIVVAGMYAFDMLKGRSDDGSPAYAAYQPLSDASNETDLAISTEPLNPAENLTQPAPSNDSADPVSVDESNIHKAAAEFDRVLRSSGMIGAEAYSRACRASAVQSGQWRDFDFCSAFDYTAAYVDHSVTNGSGMPLNQYFSTNTDPRNQESLYALEAGMGYLAQNRGATIQQLAIRSIDEIVLSRSGAE